MGILIKIRACVRMLQLSNYISQTECSEGRIGQQSIVLDILLLLRMQKSETIKYKLLRGNRDVAK